MSIKRKKQLGQQIYGRNDSDSHMKLTYKATGN